MAVFTLMMMVGVSLFAQTNVQIVGESANGRGKRVELYAYEDMLSQVRTLIDSCKIDSLGGFSLSCYLRYPRQVMLQIEMYKQDFYIVPGQTYQLYIDTFNWDTGYHHNIWFDPVPLPIWIKNAPDEELNSRLLRLEDVVDSLLLVYGARVDKRFKPDRHIVDTLQEKVMAIIPATEDLFFERYREYMFAKMRQDMGVLSRKRMAERYIFEKPVLYHDEAYMQLFFSIFDHWLSRGTRKVGKHKLIDLVGRGDLQVLMDTVGVEELLHNEVVRELVVIQMLKEAYYDKDYNRDSVCSMLRKISGESKWEEHRRLAKNLLQQEHRIEVSHVFSLPDIDHNMVRLGNINDKWTYISFVRVGDPHCMREIETMAHFYDTLQKAGEVEFLTVVCDREFQKMYHLLKNSRRGSRYKWTWVHFDGNYQMLEQWGVTSYPSFVLLDPQGRWHYTVTPSPESGILLRGPWHKESVEGDNGEEYFK